MANAQRIGIRSQSGGVSTQLYFALEAGGLGGVGITSLGSDGTPYTLLNTDIDDLGGGSFTASPSGQFSLFKEFSDAWTFWFTPASGVYNSIDVRALVVGGSGGLVVDILLDDNGTITEIFTGIGFIFEGPFSTSLFSAFEATDIVVGAGGPPPDFWTSFIKTSETFRA